MLPRYPGATSVDFRVQPRGSKRQTSGVGQVLRFQLEDPWNGGKHSLRGPGRWFWQCCLPAPQPGSETAALQEAHWPDSCTLHLLTSPSALCTRSAVLTTGMKTKEGSQTTPTHPQNSGPRERRGLLSSFLLPLTPLPITNDQEFLYLRSQDWLLQANGRQNYWQESRELWQLQCTTCFLSQPSSQGMEIHNTFYLFMRILWVKVNSNMEVKDRKISIYV